MRDDEVLRRIAARVAAHDYSDDVYIRPGHQDASGMWVVNPMPEGTRWLVARGSQEHLAALAADAVDPLPPLEPASVQAVDDAEQVLGHPLPPLLRRIYLEVANGGFGPVLGIAGGCTDDLGRTAIDRLNPREPAGLLPIAHWGCAIYSYVDCAGRGAMMWGFDPNSGLGEHSFYSEGIPLVDWLDAWLNGCLEPPHLDSDRTSWWGATNPERGRRQPDPEFVDPSQPTLFQA
ncbi:SMI1/KNR4 family protein [Micromonospora sp. 050-3]|uniref:SMI1/KNR4 family protein n=1 Tax=Micromonospora sp. 050-3 TaxID=2789265 RepID=UPI003979E49A